MEEAQTTEAPDTAEKLYPDQAAPEAETPEAEQPAAEKPEAEQPEAEKPDAEQPEPEVASFEGLTSKEGDAPVAEEDFKQLQTLFQDSGLELKQETAQKLIDFEQERVRQMQAAQQDAHKQQLEQWADAAKQDKDLGGEKFDENLTAAREALGKLATPELRDVLEQTGLGSHPEMVRLFHKLAPLVREDRPGTPVSQQAEKERGRLERLYGSTT